LFISFSLITLSLSPIENPHHHTDTSEVENMVKGKEEIFHLICRSTIGSFAGELPRIQMLEVDVSKSQNHDKNKSFGNLISHVI
jgi:hypothetical protein